MNLEEAYREVERFSKFFRAFEKIHEVLQFLASSEQLIQEKTSKVQSLTSEIEGLEAKKRKTLSDLDRDIYDTRLITEKTIKDYHAQADFYAEEIAKMTLEHHATIKRLEDDFVHTANAYNEQLGDLEEEIRKHNDILGSVMAQIETIKSKLE